MGSTIKKEPLRRQGLVYFNVMLIGGVLKVRGQ